MIPFFCLYLSLLGRRWKREIRTGMYIQRDEAWESAGADGMSYSVGGILSGVSKINQAWDVFGVL